METNDTVFLVKQKLQDKEGTPAEMLRLVYNGKQLNDDLLLSDYNVQKESTLHIHAPISRLCSSTTIESSHLDCIVNIPYEQMTEMHSLLRYGNVHSIRHLLETSKVKSPVGNLYRCDCSVKRNWRTMNMYDCPLLHIALLTSVPSAKLLIELGANVNEASGPMPEYTENSKNAHDGRMIWDNYGKLTALHMCVLLGDVSLIELIASKGAKFMVQDSDGKTPMDIAMAEK